MSGETSESQVRLSATPIRRLLAFAKPHAGGFLVSTTLLLIIAALSLVVPKLVGDAVDLFLVPSQASEAGVEGASVAVDSGEQTRRDGLRETAWWMAIIACSIFVLRYAQVLITNRTGQRVIHDLRMAVFGHIHGRSLRFFDRQPVGTLVTRVTGDIETLNEFFVSGVDYLAFDLIRIVFIIGLLFGIDVQMALAALSVAPFILIWAFVFQRRARRLFRHVRSTVSDANAYTNEALGGVRVVQAFARESQVSGRFSKRNDALADAHLKTVRNFSWFFPGMEILGALGQAAVLTTGWLLVRGDEVAVGSVVETWLYFSMFIQPLRELADRYNILQSAVASGERVFEVLDDRSALPLPEQPKRPQAPRGEVHFDAVHFHYDPRKPVLENVSLHVPAGASCALVGPTGSGKSTVIALLCRFYDPIQGRVSLDGEDLRDLDPAALRKRVGVVLQDVFLFEGSVRENLTLGDADIPDERLLSAAEAVRALPVIERLGGLDANLAERGAGLSTGEKQLLAFARTLAHDPAVLVLDEATAHIDSDTEHLLQAGLKTLMEGRTSIVIAHRLSTIVGSDQILVLHRGSVRERGRHAELLAQDGLYARLYRMQFGQDAGRTPAAGSPGSASVAPRAGEDRRDGGGEEGGADRDDDRDDGDPGGIR